MKKRPCISDVIASLVLIVGFLPILVIIVPVLLLGLHSCVAETPAQELLMQETTQEIYVEETTYTYKTEGRREIVAYTPDGWPVYEDDLLPPPAEYYFDEFGVLYQLVDGTYDEYVIDEDYQDEVDTPESTAFSYIMYHPYSETLMVVFRKSGADYYYYDVPADVWFSFKTSESKGSFFNSEIKGQYESERG